MNFRLSKYVSIRFLKNTKIPATWKVENELTVDKDEIKDSHNAKVTKKIFSVQLNAVNENIVCIKWKKKRRTTE